VNRPYRPLEETLEELRRVFSEEEIDRLLRQATIQQADGASADRDYLLRRVGELHNVSWDEAQPIVAELLRILAQLVASVETLWASLARLELRMDRFEGEEDWE
jgi:hypothetical protein